MTEQRLNEILKKHTKWLNGEPGGERANFQGENLQGVNFQGVDLREANFRGANLRGANFFIANLQGASFQGAILYRAELWEAHNIPDYIYPICCPEKGSFIGFKKALAVDKNTRVIVELEILAEAKRSSATSRKCRCDKAKVLSITDLQGTAEFQTAVSIRDNNFIYEVGKTVIVDDFDEDRWDECSTGIHFFITRNEAVAY